MKPSNFQIDSIKFIINSSEGFAHLLNQITELQLRNVEHTGVGCIYTYHVDSNDTLILQTKDLILNWGFHVTAEALPHGAALTLWIKGGKIDTLEVLAHGADFPDQDPEIYFFEQLPVNIIIDKSEN